MSSRERFEAWHEDYLKKDIQLHTKWDVWKARDAEVERLVEALRELIAAADNSVSAEGSDDIAAMLRYGTADSTARALLREHEETRDE